MIAWHVAIFVVVITISCTSTFTSKDLSTNSGITLFIFMLSLRALCSRRLQSASIANDVGGRFHADVAPSGGERNAIATDAILQIF